MPKYLTLIITTLKINTFPVYRKHKYSFEY